MIKIIFIWGILLINISCIAQVKDETETHYYKEGNWEFGFSSSIGQSNVKTKSTSTYNYEGLQTYTYESTEGKVSVHIGTSAGYYIINRLSIEPELNIILNSDEILTSLLANLCYTFYTPQQNISPYLKFGYGYSSFSKSVLFESMDYKTINAGLGLKSMYYPGLAIKVEINYKHLGPHSDSFSDPSYSFKSENSISIFSISFGLSILL